MQNLNHDERVQLARLVVELLDTWKVEPSDQVVLLGLPSETRPRAMRRYREGTPLPDEPHIWERIEHLIGIADALRTSYPLNAAAGALWMNQANRLFDNRTPLVAMLEDGLAGLVTIRMHLDCAYDWELNGQLP